MKRAMIEKSNATLSVSKQCKVLSLSRSSVHYTRKGESAYNFELMRIIDKQFLETPFYGVQQMTWHLQARGHKVIFWPIGSTLQTGQNMTLARDHRDDHQ